MPTSTGAATSARIANWERYKNASKDPTVENTWINSRGFRICLTCKRDHARLSKAS